MQTHQPPPTAHSARLLQDCIATSLAETLPIPLAPNAQIDKTTFINLAIESTIHSRTITATLEIKQASGTAPCDTDTIFYHFNKLTTPAIVDWYQQNNNLILAQAKARAALRQPTWYAIDDKRKPFYGKPDNLTTSGQKKAGTNQAYGVTTSESLQPRRRLTAALEPIRPLDRPSKRLQAILETTKKHANPAGYLIDAGFFGLDNLTVLRDQNARYLMGAPTTKRIRSLWQTHHRDSILTKNEPECTEHILVIPDHEVIRNKRDRITTTLILLHRQEPREAQLHAWVTNATQDPKAAAKLVDAYRQRWGIETGYRSKNEAHAYTASTHPPIRLFLILLSFLLYNWWRLTDWSQRTRGAAIAKPELMYYVFRELLLWTRILAAPWLR